MKKTKAGPQPVSQKKSIAPQEKSPPPAAAAVRAAVPPLSSIPSLSIARFAGTLFPARSDTPRPWGNEDSPTARRHASQLEKIRKEIERERQDPQLFRSEAKSSRTPETAAQKEARFADADEPAGTPKTLGSVHGVLKK